MKNSGPIKVNQKIAFRGFTVDFKSERNLVVHIFSTLFQSVVQLNTKGKINSEKANYSYFMPKIYKLQFRLVNTLQ